MTFEKINYSYQATDDLFVHYPMHYDDIKKLNDSQKIFDELNKLPEESIQIILKNFGLTVWVNTYERFNKYYNLKAWNLKSNREMDAGFEGTVKET